MQRSVLLGLIAAVVLLGSSGCSQDEATTTNSQVQNSFGPNFTMALATETLVDIGIPLAEGSGVEIAGIGLVGLVTSAQPGEISINVPGEVKQVILFWTGHNATEGGDPDITISNGGGDMNITGTLVGGPTLFFNGAWSSTYRKDITSLGLVSAGPNSVFVSGMDYTTICPWLCQNLGAGLLVIYDDGSDTADIVVREGNDNAFYDFLPPLDTTDPQVFNFPSSPVERTAKFHMFAGSVAQFPSEGGRPNTVTVEIDGATTYYVDPFQGNSGDDFDAVTIDIVVPVGATSMTVQALSEQHADSDFTGIPASFNWLCATLVVPPGDDGPMGCRVTGGLVDESGNCVDCPEGSSGNNFFTAGGQAGANTALPPQPSGNWTHRQHRGSAGQFTFHAGTPSAPPGTEIAWIMCNDPGWCVQARPAPDKQIDFAGVGTFKNMKNNTPNSIKDHVDVGESLHWFEVNIDDLGEPGRAGKQDPPTSQCPANGFGRDGDTEFADCDCPDFYRIRIYEGPTDASPVMYEASGYIGGGNFQIHPLTGFDGN